MSNEENKGLETEVDVNSNSFSEADFDFNTEEAYNEPTATNIQIETQLKASAQENNEEIFIPPESDDPPMAVDERWLLSYSDLMTLLFGLFILLFSMRSPEHRDAVHKAIQKKFSGNKKEIKEIKTNSDFTKNKEKIKQQEVKITQLQSENTSLKIKINKIISENKKMGSKSQKIVEEKNQMEKELKETKIVLSKIQKQKKLIQRKLASVSPYDSNDIKKKEDVRENLKKELEEIQSTISDLRKKKIKVAKEIDQKIKKNKKIKELNLKSKEQQSELAKQLQTSSQMIEELKTESDSQKKKIEDLNKTITTQNSEIEELEKEIFDQKNKNENLKTKIYSTKSFMAIMTKWNTLNHDIDLSVTDPNGKVFNFKKKTHPKSPGLFALDSRRGPGAELWQTDELVPGKYKATVTFYSQYGNRKPASVTLDVYSSSGKVAIPEFKIDFNKSRSKEFYFEVNKEGEVKFSK